MFQQSSLGCNSSRFHIFINNSRMNFEVYMHILKNRSFSNNQVWTYLEPYCTTKNILEKILISLEDFKNHFHTNEVLANRELMV